MANEVRHRGFGRWTIEDDRGELRPYVLNSGRKGLSPRQKHELDRALAWSGSAQNDMATLLTGVGATLVASMLFLPLPFHNASLLQRTVAYAAVVALLVYLVWVGWRRLQIVPRTRSPVVAGLILRQRLCPACCAPLPPSELEHEFVDCSSCHASWSTARVPAEPFERAKTSAIADAITDRGLSPNGPLGVDDAGRPAVATTSVRREVTVPRASRIAGLWLRPTWPLWIVGAVPTVGLVSSGRWWGVLIGSIGVVVLMVIENRVWFGRIRRQMLRRDMCPSCAHELDGLALDADGFVRCPLCEAAWRAEDVGERTDTTLAGIVGAP